MRVNQSASACARGAAPRARSTTIAEARARMSGTQASTGSRSGRGLSDERAEHLAVVARLLAKVHDDAHQQLHTGLRLLDEELLEVGVADLQGGDIRHGGGGTEPVSR